MSKCSDCKFYAMNYEFDTYYMSLVAVEKCTKMNKIFTENCADFKKELKE